MKVKVPGFTLIIQNEFIFFVIVIFILFSSCKKEHMFDCFKDTGKTISADRPVNPFNRIDIQNNVDLVVHFGIPYELKVTAGTNLIDGITTEVRDSILYIKNENKCNWVRDFNNKYTVDITTDDLINLVNWGSGNVTFADTLVTYEFVYDNWNASGIMNFKFNGERILVKIHTGTADVTVQGKTGLNYIWLFGYGYMNCKDLQANEAFIVNMGTGDCRIQVKNDLHAEIEYMGNIYYSGEPHTLTTNITGTGQLIHE